MTLWLLDPDTWHAMEQARLSGLTPTAEQAAEFSARALASEGSSIRGLTIAGSTAEVAISGVLTKTPNLFAMLFGGGNTAYSQVRDALAAAQADPSVRDIVLRIDSPGGEVTGLFETIDAIRAVTKPVAAKVSSALSAAYGLAAAASKIEAVGPGSSFGSIGVVGRFFVDDKTVEITSTHAPDKRPNPTTAEGQDVIRAHLDEIHELYASAIAEGRKTTVETVNTTYGQGRQFLAQEALKRGLIDSISRPALKAVPTSTQASQGKGIKPMKFSEYRAAHPDEAAQAITEGVTQERERVQAHLTMGAQCGDLSIAIEAINGAVAFGHAPTQARYMAAAMNRKDQAARVEDNQQVTEATANAEAPKATADLGDALAELMLGKETK